MVTNTLQLDVEVILHATEDLDKVTNALARLLTGNAPIIIEVLVGHYGNPIYRVFSSIKDEELVITVLRAICSSLVNRDYLLKTIDRRVDTSGNIFIRLDKQGFVNGRIMLSDGDDVIRIRVKVRDNDAVQFINGVCS
ncbi:RNA-binding domain-containing protein [Vulcanisaeta souniana]|uniref:Exosome subunit n=1 Tax=Vulcanisaeta souniana JCM 11219 TaxID=1293586 RepID=A0A830E377_9CREN|nr:RNA-binding domain-containing protein [Vulcanisaeta souniana]BDR93511.1 exosome subunit [Vulcanisaeta souniana JCM 11219]GGI77719.1 exosome subunit [Vulcanisaeta souniana JCM 11219]